ncbi:MAG: YkgJ family cysteine cluster protein, partial [Ilumatobacteraceae bacterium]
AGTLLIGTDETLDADDSLAQMIFHEICHAIVAGPENFGSTDWGLDNNNAVERSHCASGVKATSRSA